MKKIVSLIVIVICGISLNAQEHSATIKVHGLESSDGKVIIRVFNKAKGFPKNHTTAYKIIKAKVVNKQSEVTIKLPSGDYAFAIIHDKNNNNTLDKNWVGMPVESVGLSNLDNIGKPSFEKSAIRIDKNLTINIKVRKMF